MNKNHKLITIGLIVEVFNIEISFCYAYRSRIGFSKSPFHSVLREWL